MIPFKERKTYTGWLTKINSNQIFVFGSNIGGIHGSGNAKAAKDHFGAVQNVAMGLQGNSWAIVTTKLHFLNVISPYFVKAQILTLYTFAADNPDLEFFIAYDAKGPYRSGFTAEELAKLFYDKNLPQNIIFEKGFNALVESVHEASLRELNMDGFISEASISKLKDPNE